MTYYSGQNGSIGVKPQQSSGVFHGVGSLKNWSLNMQMSVLDCTSLADTDRIIIPGIRSYTGSASMHYYQESRSNVEKMIENTFYKSTKTDPQAVNFGQNNPAVMASVKLELKEGSDVYFILCDCYITSFSVTCAVGDVVSADVSWEGVGLPSQLQL